MKLVFYIARRYGIPVVKPIIAYLQQHKPTYSYAFYTSREVQNAFPPEWDSARILPHISAARSYEPDAVLCTGNYVDYRIPGIKVQLFHGVGIEKASHYKIRHFFDLYCTCGPCVTEVFKRNARLYPYFEVAETGWPKFDHILNYQAPKSSSAPELVTDSKTILYAPTFSRRLHSAWELLHTIPQIIEPHERWIVKYHELMDAQWIAACKQLAKKHAITLVGSSEDITPYLWESDIMISDTSSVIYEFIALGKPVITYNTLGSDQKGYAITQPGMLRKALDSVSKNPEYYVKKGLQELLKVNPYTDGLCSKRVIEAVEKQVQRVPTMHKKPLNLFRKAQVLWHYYFKKGYLD